MNIRIKKLTKVMCILSILAIVFILIMHMVSWAPVISDSKATKEKWDRHITIEANRCERPNCSECDEYKAIIREHNKLGADLCQQTITNCVLIALASTITYSVGFIADKKQEKTIQELLNS